MILRPQLEVTDHQSVLDYYIQHYAEVHIITCNKCKADMGVEIRGQVGEYKHNRLGFTVLPLGDRLLASRVRTDDSMGYQCNCGNDTRGTKIEEKLSPEGKFLPHEIAAIMQEQIRVGWVPKIKTNGTKQVHETFTRERIK